MVTGHLSPLVTVETPRPKPQSPREPRGSAASEPMTTKETQPETHHTVCHGHGQGSRHWAFRLSLKGTHDSKNSGFQGEKNARSYNLSNSCPLPCSASLQRLGLKMSQLSTWEQGVVQRKTRGEENMDPPLSQKWMASPPAKR